MHRWRDACFEELPPSVWHGASQDVPFSPPGQILFQLISKVQTIVHTQVELAAAAAEDTEAALAADPHNDLAHHLLGRWHTEMAQVCCSTLKYCSGCFFPSW